jgi:hypothetical protein
MRLDLFGGEATMPVHDWTRVEDGIFHDFHVAWIPELRKTLNGGLLPEGYYALAEQHAGKSIADMPTRTLAIRHERGHRLVALFEIVSPANKDRARHVEIFAAKVVSALDAGVHVLVVDIFPPGPSDPHGMHGVIRQRLEHPDAPFDLPADEPLTLVSYASGPHVEAYLEPVGVGAELPDMPLFLCPDRYVNVPLEPTYLAAYAGMAAFWRDVLEGRESGPV